ncbi:MAG TPA: ABATE domain-containing protein [Gemmatimonadales bacterium]|nr:ABATE domain-containing protein [Gemmatimonadales bacterium]
MGDPLAIQLVNTVGSRGSPRPRERLATYASLVEWCIRSELIGRSEGDRLLAEAAKRPADAERALARARDLREVLFRLFQRFAAGAQPDPADLEALNAALGGCVGRRRLRLGEVGCCWAWSDAPDSELDWMLWPVAYSAAEILTGSSLERLKICANEECSWMFIDQSRNRSRRWCDMRECGNREKARRHYHRGRAEQETGGAPHA